MKIVGIVLLLLLTGLVIYMVISVYRSGKTSGELVLIQDSVPGITPTTLQKFVPLSLNQPEGITFSYTGWILVKDFTVGYGKERRIFTRGDCPGLYLDGTSNSLVVAIKTYGSRETILISNIPASKWVHFGIVVNQDSVDIYINGTLRQHHTLGQLPDQTTEALVQVGGNWEGTLGRLSYYPRSLTNSEIRAKSMETPPPDLNPKISSPNYFDITWYIGRLNSSA